MDSQNRSDGLYFLKRNPLFSPLGDDVLMELVGKLQSLTIDRSATILREGDPGQALFLIKSGRIRITSQFGKEGENTVAYLGRGDAVGELSLLTGEPYPFSAVADTACELLTLGKSEFDQILEAHPLVGIHLSRALSKRLAVSFHPPHDKPKEPQRIMVFPALPHEALILSTVNLAMALVEQTRRKVILVDLTARSGDMARSLGLNPPMSMDAMLREQDFLDIHALRQVITVHPSGLEVLSLHPKLVKEHLLGVVPSLLGLLKDHYDFALLVSPTEEDDLIPILMRESDRALGIVWDQAIELADTSLPRLRMLADNETVPFTTVYLHHPSSRNAFKANFRVPWSEAFHQPFRATGTPYLTHDQGGSAIEALERVARALGKLRVGLAMGSGAAFGYTLVGILKIFEREGIPIDVVAGTSMGALLGSFFCAGHSPSKIEDISRSITKKWLLKNMFGDLTFPHSGFMAGQTLSGFLRSVLGTVEFDQLRIPFATVATDIRTGQEVVLREGRVADAVRASTSLPILFQPFKYGDRYLVDGGLVNPVPTSIVSNMGADILISVNLTAKPSLRKIPGRRKILPLVPEAPNMAEVFFKMLYTMQYEIAQARVEIAHIVIAPDLRDYNWTEFHRSDDILKSGIVAAEEALPKIKSLLPFFSDHCKVPLGISLRAY